MRDEIKKSEVDKKLKEGQRDTENAKAREIENLILQAREKKEAFERYAEQASKYREWALFLQVHLINGGLSS